MKKYSLVVFHNDYEQFLQQLQELGLVDVTISKWEPNDNERALVDKIDNYNQAVKNLKNVAESQKEQKPTRQNINVDAAFEQYKTASDKLSKLKSELENISKEIAELVAWGDFDVTYIDKLKKSGVGLHFYEESEKTFEKFNAEWSEKYAVTEINRIDGRVYFVIAALLTEKVEIGLTEIKTPETDHSQAVDKKAEIEKQISEQEKIISNSTAYIDDFEAESMRLSDTLHLSKVERSGEEAADGKLLVLEGWATVDTQAQVEKMLDNTPGVVYIKENPTPDDNTPVKLKNNHFAQLFEIIGDMYAKPKYGTFDMTKFCAPFYMFFFGFCLCDGGYGLIFIIASLFMKHKFKGNESMERVAGMSLWCGISTLLFGILTGSFFGVQLADFAIFKPYKNLFLDTNKLFTLSLAVGVVHLIIAMCVKVYAKIKYFGLKYALSTIGWLLVIISVLLMLAPMAGINLGVPNVVWYAIIGVGVFLMLFCNAPGKSIIANFGGGLWNTYNDVTGFIGDVLSYLRLFAIGLSGSVLALVFNQLAVEMSPNFPVVKQIVMIAILLFGHGINLFMSSLSAFVHPMRLTFVEFYKNAGFEAGSRTFTPLKK